MVEGGSAPVQDDEQPRAHPAVSGRNSLQHRADLPFASERDSRPPGALLRRGAFRRSGIHQIGHPPVIVDLLAENDDDHILALFRRHGRIGAVAKSNFVGLRYREPVYRTIRELALSYFEFYFNIDREKTLRSYAAALDLTRLDRFDWRTTDENLEEVEKALGRQRVITLISPEMAAAFAPVDARSYDAGLMGADAAGLYQPAGKTR